MPIELCNALHFTGSTKQLFARISAFGSLNIVVSYLFNFKRKDLLKR